MKEKTLAEMTTEELVSFWCGKILIEIGRGEFRGAVTGMLLHTMKESYDRGFTDGKKTGKPLTK